jgi:hypothetical protein
MKIFLSLLLIMLFQKVMSQSVEIDHYEIDQLKIKTVSESKIRFENNLPIDTFPIYKAFYDSIGKIMEKHYNFRKRNSNDFIFSKEIFIYNENGKLIDIKSYELPRYHKEKIGSYTECKFYEYGKIIKVETIWKHLIQVSEFNYRKYPLKDDVFPWEINLPIKIDYFENDTLVKTINIDYTFW